MSEKENIVSNVEKIVLPAIKKLGLELVDVEYVQEGGFWYLRIFIEKNSGSVSLEDCANLSNAIDEDVDRIIEEKFFLEVSSPGIERPLKKLSDFQRFSGKNIKVILNHKINDSKNFTGKLLGVEISEPEKESLIILDLNINLDKKKSKEKIPDEIKIPFKEIKKANIVFDFSSIEESKEEI
ncbi:MAG: ribosome maturation factor RimP [Fusobacteriaceae bacterium]